MSSLSKKLKNYSVGYFILGLLLFGIGMYSMFVPGVTFLTFGIAFSIILLVNGIMELGMSFSDAVPGGWKGWNFVFGILNILFGGYLMFFPAASAMVLSYTMIFVLMFNSMSAIGRSFDIKQISNGQSWLILILGFLGLFLSFYLLEYPLLGAEFSVIWIASGISVWGLFMMIFGGYLKKI